MGGGCGAARVLALFSVPSPPAPAFPTRPVPCSPALCLSHPPCPVPARPVPPPGEYIAAGDMLEAEQGKAMALKKSVAEAERRVSELASANSGLNRELEHVK